MDSPAPSTRRILLLVTDLQIGGTPSVVRELALRLNSPPHVQVDVACLSGRGPVADQLEAGGVQVIALDARHALDLRAIVRLARLVRRNQYDTVLSFLIHANAAAALIAPLFPHVRMLQSIQTTQPWPRWHWLVQSVAHHVAESVVVPSPSVGYVAHQWANVPWERIVVIANAIDVKSFEDLPRVEPPVTGHSFHIGFIGRLDPVKRLTDLIEAMGLLGNEVRLHIFGEGSERAELESLITASGLSDRVIMHGAVPRPQEALAQLELLVLPSAAEGFGLVLIEAMAAGVPVVATDVAGICDVVRHRQTGVLVPPASPHLLAKAIQTLLNNPAIRQRLAAQARQDVERRFTWKQVLPGYRRLLRLEATAGE